MNDFIAQHRDDYLDQLFNMLKQKSISTDRDAIRNCANVLKGDMEALGLHTQIMETGGNPVVYGELLNDKNRFTLLIYGHRCAGEFITIVIMRTTLDFLINHLEFEFPEQDFGFEFNDIPAVPNDKVKIKPTRIK